jgi:dTDP-4-amino-4,6-dideoxygalactose transaminase
MQFVDLKNQYLSVRGEIDAAVMRVLESGSYILGSEVAAFESELAQFAGARHAIGLNSGADALYLALRALGVGPGDEVITTPFTMIASAEVISRCGATPVFVDIARDTFNIDPALIERALSRRTRAIIPVHLFGLPVDMTAIMRLAKKRKLAIVEDACQSIGAKWDGRMVGSIGDAGCFSFFPAKNLGGFGDGGMVTTNNRRIAERVRILRAHGAKKKYHHPVLGVNSRLDTLQAAILRVKLRHLEDWTEARRRAASRYDAALADLTEVALPKSSPSAYHVYHQYTIRAQRRDALAGHLRSKGIPFMQYYPLPLHLQGAFKHLGYRRGDLPEAERACRESLSLPIDPAITQQDQSAVVAAIAGFYTQG